MPAHSTPLSDWLGRPDPENRGRDLGWHKLAPDANWRPVSLPGAMQSHFGPAAPPVCWYRRTLSAADLARDANDRVIIRFESAATDVTVFVNGQQIGNHVGDWVPFQFDITSALSEDHPAEVVIRVDRIAPAKEVWIDGAPVQGGHLTKGFHDVLSIHKGGLWLPVHLDITGPLALIPDGLGILASASTGDVHVDVELAHNLSGGWLHLKITDSAARTVAQSRVQLAADDTTARVNLRVDAPLPWSPDSPTLYTLEAALVDDAERISQRIRTTFGFRRAQLGGENNRQILLNDQPIFLRGILDWGHEPRHLSPTPTPEELRARFAALKALGFNLVCICMWYPPQYYYDIADEMGMLLWQEHPVWKSPMGDEHIPDYQQQYTKFFRRDRNHPSVILVSGSCEHERFNPKLAEWWWSRVRTLMPDRLAQIQTAFFAWTDLKKTDAYDEHTYDSSGRWTHYLEDLRHDLDKLPPKPFIMGESILYLNWPNTAELLAAHPPDQPAPWWFPRAISAIADFERRVITRHGQAALDDFKRRARRFHLQGRKFQFELFRAHDFHAGLVMNHLRDVPACRCGFQDEQDRWYFSPDETMPWLAPAPILLRTPQHLRGLRSGAAVPIEIGVSNFSESPIDAPAHLAATGAALNIPRPIHFSADLGQIKWQSLHLCLPVVTKPTRVQVDAKVMGAHANSWTLWAIPAPARTIPGAARLADPSFDDVDRQLDFEDRAYSSGWGSPARSWKPLLPDPAVLAPSLPAWRGPAEHADRALLAHKLTPEVVDFLVSGGRVVHTVSRARQSAPTKFINIWGQLPLILEQGPLAPGDADWVADLLDHDLSRRSLRAVPIGELGLEESLEPIIRLVYCHDIVDRPRLYDYLSMARVGNGLLILSAADHSTPAGEYLLQRILTFAAGPSATSSAVLDESIVRAWSAITADAPPASPAPPGHGQ